MKKRHALTHAWFAGSLILPMLSHASARPLINIPLPTGATAASSAANADNFTAHLLGTANANRRALWALGMPQSITSSTAFLIPAIPRPGYYPGDLGPGNQVTVQSAQHHGFYINGVPSTWGTPATFLTNLGNSDFIHITDQYVGSTSNNRYTVGTEAAGTGTLPHILYDADILSLVHTVASAIGGTGYHHIYHLYLPPNQDVCSGTAPPSDCYSPDMPNVWTFCAYHGSVDFKDIGHVLFTVEPYQNVNGCAVHAPSPNSSLIDSTADILSHEVFETITDPDGTSWWNRTSLDLFGAEIGDECQNATFNYGAVQINGRLYEVQPEYVNSLHGCAFSATTPPNANY